MGTAASPSTITAVAPSSLTATASDEWPWAYIEGITSALGRLVASCGGVAATRVRVDLAPTDAELRVETTNGFPDAGSLWCGPYRLTYTGKTASAFTGVTEYHGYDRLETVGIRAMVYLDPGGSLPGVVGEVGLGSVDVLGRAVNLALAGGDDFKALCGLYGFGWPGGGISENDWRNAILPSAFGRSGVHWSVFEFARNALRRFQAEREVSVSAAAPQTLTAVSGVFGDSHTGVFVRRADTGDVWLSVGRTSTTLELAGVGFGSYWTAAEFSTSETFTVEILPFVITEEPGWVVINVVSSVAQAFVPPTYLKGGVGSPPAPSPVSQSTAEGAAYNGGALDPVPASSSLTGAEARPAGEPFGGQMQLDSLLDVGDPSGAGPHPPYLTSGVFFGKYAEVLDLRLPVGYRARFQAMV